MWDERFDGGGNGSGDVGSVAVILGLVVFMWLALTLL